MDDQTPYAAECAYCGLKFPAALPACQRENLAAHIEHCPQHPLFRMARERNALRDMLGVILDRCRQGVMPNKTLLAAARKLWRETQPAKEPTKPCR